VPKSSKACRPVVLFEQSSPSVCALVIFSLRFLYQSSFLGWLRPNCNCNIGLRVTLGSQRTGSTSRFGHSCFGQEWMKWALQHVRTKCGGEYLQHLMAINGGGIDYMRWLSMKALTDNMRWLSMAMGDNGCLLAGTLVVYCSGMRALRVGATTLLGFLLIATLVWGISILIYVELPTRQVRTPTLSEIRVWGT
jgi:hypothetical protein